MIAAFMAVNTYLIDAFTLYAASAIAANTILRSVRKIGSFPSISPSKQGCSEGRRVTNRCRFEQQVLGAVFPLFGLQMYNALGLVSSFFCNSGWLTARMV
jgi:hypothetical protein